MYLSQFKECPTLWRIYQYVDDAEKTLILEARAQLMNLPLGEGGEGYIARDEWCYNCGGIGHLGDVSRFSHSTKLLTILILTRSSCHRIVRTVLDHPTALTSPRRSASTTS